MQADPVTQGENLRNRATFRGQPPITREMKSVQPQGGRSDRGSGRRTRDMRRGRGDDGAALVEFAFVALLLFTLLFGIMEFGWSFYQLNDVRQGAREGARLAAVNYKTSDVSGSSQTAQIVAEVCDRIEEGNVDLVLTSSGSGIGDSVTFTVQRKYDALTGFFKSVYNPVSINSTVEMRLEQTATFDPEPDEADFKDCP